MQRWCFADLDLQLWMYLQQGPIRSENVFRLQFLKEIQFVYCLKAFIPIPQDLGRRLSPQEMISTHLVPTTANHARICGAPKLITDGATATQLVSCAGNAMNTACVGALVLACVMTMGKA